MSSNDNDGPRNLWPDLSPELQKVLKARLDADRDMTPEKRREVMDQMQRNARRAIDRRRRMGLVSRRDSDD